MIFRAAESKKNAIRLSGNGVSGYINREGQVQNISSLNKQKNDIYRKKNKRNFLQNIDKSMHLKITA